MFHLVTPLFHLDPLRMELLREHRSFALVGLELYQAGLEEEVQVDTNDTGSRSLGKVM